MESDTDFSVVLSDGVETARIESPPLRKYWPVVPEDIAEALEENGLAVIEKEDLARLAAVADAAQQAMSESGDWHPRGLAELRKALALLPGRSETPGGRQP